MLCMLYLRACESRLANPILGDQRAAEDVARIEYDFRRIHRRIAPSFNQFGVALRSAHFDAWIVNYLNSHPDSVVLHLGCGLHSRPVRLAVPDTTYWFDVDLPEVIDLRRNLYTESDRYRMVGSSVTEHEWLDDLPTGGPVLIVAEGLLMYLTPTEVTELLHRLADRFDTGELLADLLSEWGPRLSRIMTSGIIKWGTRDGREITRWDSRLRLMESVPVVNGFDRIPFTRQRSLYRMVHAVPTARNYDRLFRYAF
ncbi:class I SAM-dependent methyltransferase [Mycolicibacterium celeriflavum]|uniref:class I SAM-dependent methyltransferase n=1 Tax=Mycolicibacterium celeriflavum TaxID=1249101 RepID=UPI003CEE102E